MGELNITQQSLPEPSDLYGDKTELKDIRELKVGEGSTIFFTDKEGSRWGHPTFAQAKAWIKVDGSAKFRTATGQILLSSDAIDGNFINVINTALNTSSKTILTDFTFQSTDYAGAFKAGNPTWDENTGLITGGSGVLINARGILGANNGTATFTLDATTGNATFAGDLVAATGTLGALTIASGGNIKFGKTAYTDDTHSGLWLGDVSETAKFNIGSSATKFFHYDGTDFTFSGGTIQTGTAGLRTKLDADNIRFYSDNTVKAFIRPDTGKSIVIGSADDFYFTNLAGVPYFKLNSNGNFEFSAGETDIIWPDGPTIHDAASELQMNCYLRVQEAYRVRKSTTTYDGSDESQKVITSVYAVANGADTDLRQKYRTLTFKGGIITSISSESNELVLAKVWNG